MSDRKSGQKRVGKRGTTTEPCVVMTCDDRREADQVSRQLRDLDEGCLVTYDRAEDLMRSVPSSRVALVILAARAQPPAMRRTLRWVRRRWPRCPVTVVGDKGCGDDEMTARLGGATYVLRAAAKTHWPDLLRHALDSAKRSREAAR